ncbi:hypothetical protein [Macrococcus capreoli]|uniref:hypothetical protein n=1 Tax=Macrococcus capreoli TaxID=2982690 RepID=UPI003F41FAE9
MKNQQLLNRLKFNASLEKLIDTIDENDRPVKSFSQIRLLKYGVLCVTTTDKEYGAQIGHDLTHKIECRIDFNIIDHENEYRIVIRKQRFAIARIYIDYPEKRMELTLYADNAKTIN